MDQKGTAYPGLFDKKRKIHKKKSLFHTGCFLELNIKINHLGHVIFSDFV